MKIYGYQEECSWLLEVQDIFKKLTCFSKGNNATTLGGGNGSTIVSEEKWILAISKVTWECVPTTNSRAATFRH